MAKYSADQAADEVVDAQAALEPTRSECVRPVVLDHVHRWMRAKSMADKFMELDGLIRICLPHMTDPNAVKEVEEALNNSLLRGDIITKNHDLVLAGIPVSIIEDNECWIRYPFLADVWYMVQKDLTRSSFLPWALQYPDAALEGMTLNRLMEDIEAGEFEKDLRSASASMFPSSSNEDALRTENPRLVREISELPKGGELPAAKSAPPPLAGEQQPPLSDIVNDVTLSHKEKMERLWVEVNKNVEHMDVIEPGEEPVPPEEIDSAAEKVKRVLRKIPKGSKDKPKGDSVDG